MAINKIKERARPWQDARWLRCQRHLARWLALRGGRAFFKLIDYPAITDVLTEIIGSHLRCEAARAGATGTVRPEMHGGHRGGRVNFRYDVYNGQIYTGLTVVSIALQDISEADGSARCARQPQVDFIPPEDRQSFCFGAARAQY